MRQLLHQYVSPEPLVFNSKQKAYEVLAQLRQKKANAAPVIDSTGSILGIVTIEDLVQSDMEGSVIKCLNADWTTVPRDVSLEIAFKKKATWIIPIDEQGNPLGIIPRAQIADLVFEIYETTLNRLNAVMDSAHNGIIALDCNGIITNYNQAAEIMFGVPQEEAIGRNIKEVDPESTLMDVVTSGQMQMTQKRKLPKGLVMSNRRPIIRNGQVIGVVAVFQDLTELEEAHTELRSVQELNKELESILEFSYDGLSISDDSGRFLRISPSFGKLLNIPIEDLIGKSVNEVTDQVLPIISVIESALEKRIPITMTEAILPGQQILATCIPVFDNQGVLVRVVTNLRDLTELNDLKQKVLESSELSKRYLEELGEWRERFIATAEVISSSLVMQRVVELALHVARVDSTVLITGESGVGKEVVAKMIHKVSPRKNGPFIEINCGAIPESLLESELFGYEKGAFTGASKEGRIGIFELANNGTLLLDEIAEMPLNLQVKLLRALQEQEIYRVGGSKPIKLNVRIIAATNKELWQMVQSRTFREDLYYRLNVVPVEIPPLRERREDIIPLANLFLKQCNDKYGLNKRLSAEVFSIFEMYNWPGNVRELQNLVERLIVTVNADEITPSHLPPLNGQEADNFSTLPIRVLGLTTLREAEEIVEKELIARALAIGKSTRKAADLLGVTHSTVVRKIRHYNLSAH